MIRVSCHLGILTTMMYVEHHRLFKFPSTEKARA